MSNYTKLYWKSSANDVKVAGNFNNWQPESLEKIDNKFIYKIKDSNEKGKYIFKFVIDGIWQTHDDYATEIDESNNENNVILYDHTNHITDYEQVESPLKTPIPTPINELSSTNSLNKIDTTKSEPALTSNLPIDSNPITKLSTNPQSKSIDSPPNPQPVGRPEPPILTTKLNDNKISNKVEPLNESSNESSEQPDKSIIKHDDNNTAYGLGFFAAILQIITQFFSGWFSR